MKKLLLASLIFLASLASFGAATVTLTNGGGCEYSVISILPTGAVTVACTGPVTVTPTTPVPQPPAPTGGGAFPTGGSYPGPNMWVYPNVRASTGDLAAGQVVTRGFTVPAQDVGKTIEVGISGANLQVFIDGSQYLGPRSATLGNHLIEIKATATANGSVDLYHY